MERFRIARRDLIAAAAASLAMPARAAARYDYARATVIDALGGPDPQEPGLLATLRASGLTAFSQTIGEVGNGPDRWPRLVADIGRWRRAIDGAPQALLLVRSGGDIARAKASARTGAILNVQDTSWVDTDLDRIATAAALGLRVVQLTYNVRNLSGDGAIEPADGGLSIFGRAMIDAIEAQRLVLDLSHGGARAMAEAAAIATRPPVVTHTGCRAIAEHPRNTSDATMRAVAAKGGFVGIYFMPYLAPGRTVSIDDVVAHVDHALAVCGEDHIGIGTDNGVSAVVDDAAYRREMKTIGAARAKAGIGAPGDADGPILYVPGLNGPGKFRTLAERLSRRGWPAGRIDKLLGGNVARVFGEVWG